LNSACAHETKKQHFVKVKPAIKPSMNIVANLLHGGCCR